MHPPAWWCWEGVAAAPPTHIQRRLYLTPSPTPPRPTPSCPTPTLLKPTPPLHHRHAIHPESSFLKARFGLGYTLVATRKPSCSPEAVLAAVRRFVPDSTLLSTAGSELSCRLPHSASLHFGALLRHLSCEMDSLGLGCYGLSISSMEEVFLRLSQLGPDGMLPESAVVSLTQPFPTTPASPMVATTAASGAAAIEVADEVEAAGGTRIGCANGSDVSEGVARGHGQHASEGREVKIGDRSEQGLGVECHTSEGIQVESSHLEGNRAKVSRVKGSRPEVMNTSLLQPAGDSSAGVWLQSLELLRKRWLCAHRDLKAVLTQQLLPVALVALVMLVLRVNVPLAGPPIQMHAGLYASRTQIVHNFAAGSPEEAHMRLDADLVRANVNDSEQLSLFLLATAQEHRDRMGAFVHDDQLRALVGEKGSGGALLNVLGSASLAGSIFCLAPTLLSEANWTNVQVQREWARRDWAVPADSLKPPANDGAAATAPPAAPGALHAASQFERWLPPAFKGAAAGSVLFAPSSFLDLPSISAQSAAVHAMLRSFAGDDFCSRALLPSWATPPQAEQPTREGMGWAGLLINGQPPLLLAESSALERMSASLLALSARLIFPLSLERVGLSSPDVPGWAAALARQSVLGPLEELLLTAEERKQLHLLRTYFRCVEMRV